MTSTAFSIIQPANGSETATDEAVGIIQNSEEREPPVQVLHSGSSNPPPGEAENSSSTAVEDLAESGNSHRKPLLLVPKEPSATSGFKALQMYEGTVQEILGTAFIANLRDKSCPEEPEQVATIALDHVWDSDRELVAPGAVFYWSAGYQVKPHGQRSLVSNIRFRRLPAWTASDLAQARGYAAELDELFDTD